MNDIKIKENIIENDIIKERDTFQEIITACRKGMQKGIKLCQGDIGNYKTEACPLGMVAQSSFYEDAEKKLNKDVIWTRGFYYGFDNMSLFARYYSLNYSKNGYLIGQKVRQYFIDEGVDLR